MFARWTDRWRRTRRVRINPRPTPATANQAPTPETQPEPAALGALGEGETVAQDSDQDQNADSDTSSASSAGRLYRRESTLRRRARKRWNASIKPRSREFRGMVEMFENQLQERGTTVNDILDEHFTTHERNLLVPADKSNNRALARIQRNNRARYRMLMRSARFSRWADKASALSVKLAMLWFGLPVAPIELRLADEFETGSDTADDIAEAETDEIRKETAKAENSLRFLNSYSQRHFGRDNLREPDPTYEAYYAFNHLYPVVKKTKPSVAPQDSSISLRGGGLSDDLLNTDVDSFNESDINVENLTDTNGSEDDRAREGQSSLTSAGVSLRGGVVTSPLQPLEARTSTPKRRSQQSERRPSVYFTPGSVLPERSDPPQTEEPVAGTRKGKDKGKGKEHARDLATERNPYIGHAEPGRQPPTREERQRGLRETTYAKPPSVHDNNNIPQNAPAVENLLRFGSSNLPTISLGVLTPTEQRRLQISYYEMRNTMLDRGQKCPYSGCDKVFSLAEDDRMQQHLAAVHTVEKCNFCDEVLYKHWTENQRRAHFLANHSNLFLTMTDLKQDNSFQDGPRPHGRVDWDRESRWKFCARCSRNHNRLDAQADRAHHDTICYPGAPSDQDGLTFCVDCGAVHDQDPTHRCQEVLNFEEPPYCEQCALPLGLFSEVYQGRHLKGCRGYSSQDARCCPWCRVGLGQDNEGKLAHLQECTKRPDATAQGPLDPETGEPWPYLPPLEEQDGEEDLEPPEVCPLCKKTILHLDAHLLLKHLEEDHEDHAGAVCVFCKLDYEARKWADDRHKILLHLDDHVHGRKGKLATELVLSMALPHKDPYKRRVLGAKDYTELKFRREREHAEEQYESVWQAYRKKIEEINKDKEQINLLKDELKEVDHQLREATATKALEYHVPEGEEEAAEPALPSAKPAVKLIKGRRKGKEKATATPTPPSKRDDRSVPTTAATEPEAENQTPLPPPTRTAQGKRKARSARPSTADPSYRPTASEESDRMSSSGNAEFRTEEGRLRAARRRRQTLNRDPSFRPDPAAERGGDEDDDADEAEGARKARKRRRRTGRW